MQGIIDRQLLKHTTIISPGVVGSVGDVNLVPRLHQSSPDMPMRFDQSVLQRESVYGSNVQDGFSKSFDSGGGPARVVDKRWTGERDFKISHGWKYQNVRVEDSRYEPINMGYNEIPEVIRVKPFGNAFLPVPGPFQLGDAIPRGGATPDVVATVNESGGQLTQGYQMNVPGEMQPLPMNSVVEQVVQPRPTSIFTLNPGMPIKSV